MTIVTKVGVSYVDHMNDDMKVDSFSHKCYQALSFPSFFWFSGESLGTWLGVTTVEMIVCSSLECIWHLLHCDSSVQCFQYTV